MGRIAEEEARVVRRIIDVASVDHATGPNAVLGTHTLGSGVALSAYDPVSRLGYLLHAVLPLSVIDPELAERNPYMFVDTGVTRMFDQFFESGGRRGRMQVKVVGCAVPLKSDHPFRVGERNLRVIEKLFAKNHIEVASHAVAGSQSRRMRLHLDTGLVVLSSGSQEWEI